MALTISDRMSGMKPSAIREIFKSLGTPGAISFAAGNPAPESFPVEEFATIAADILRNRGNEALQYGITEGYLPLRRLVQERIREKFGIGTDTDTTIITSGGQQAIELACKTLCNEGDAVICENPSFIGALNAFRSLGAEPVGVPMDEDGINIEQLEKTIRANPQAKMMYLIPTFQNPSGITMSLEKRQAVYALAQKYDLAILEDNPYGDLRFEGEDVPTLKSMDTDGRVIYCGSFSKILSAGMRVGFACGNDRFIQKMVVAKQVEDVHTNVFFQMMCAEYMTRYDLDAHINTIRDLYRRKSARMVAALERELPPCVKFTRPQGGLFLWCTVPEQVDIAELLQETTKANVFVVPGTAFNCDQNAPTSSFRMNYSMPTEEEIDRGVALLGGILHRLV